MSQAVVKVSTLVSYLKSKIDQDNYLQRILVCGEISNFVHHRSGHWYFTIKDEASRLSCVMFASSASRSKYLPKDGDQVIVQANTSVFESSGQLQLYVTGIKLDGIGDLHIQFELLKKKLFEEGYFDENHKVSIPKYPMRIGLITGKNTAAREDVVSTLYRRWPIAKLIEINTLVQGEAASQQIIEALRQMESKDVDVVLLVRGGGSIEDLWAFNDENLAKCIYNYSIPIITGVGHEVDTTIVDYVSDCRAPTPTGACELATPDKDEVIQTLALIKQTLIKQSRSDVEFERARLDRFKNMPWYQIPKSLVDQRQMKLDYASNRLQVSTFISQKKRIELDQISQAFKTLVSKRLHQVEIDLGHYTQQMNQNVIERIQREKKNMASMIHLLDAYSPLNVLKRGYAIASTTSGIITSVSQVKMDDEVKIRLTDGEIITRVNRKETNNGN
ncbi:MAG: exodeoxyribonuclease VII large subunit [Anaerorhabdus sp.]|uniref:exodeoxyribonuclease VII large subunit n=1 Tax=Anaerorhabdus sp. TaxID=1872524 RepID=UPI002FCBD335